MQTEKFKQTIWNHYHNHRRPFPWRDHIDPYHVVVSEVMLQQTQTYRVLPKFKSFIRRFSTFENLAQSSLHTVLSEWSGLGYNRRGKALHNLAKIIVEKYNSILPDTPHLLQTLPGIGPATSCSITTFAFNKPTVFIETNIRTVFIHFFFEEQKNIQDKEITKLVAETLDKNNPREWYYALMDYGVMIKSLYKNPSRKSAHYTKQSKFEGSNRQIRSLILKAVLAHKKINEKKIIEIVAKDAQKISKNITDLLKEGFIQRSNDFFQIS